MVYPGWVPDLTRYRANVAAAVFNEDGRILIARRIGATGPYVWQMPQGGIDPGERPEDAVLRELREETGIRGSLVAPLGTIDRWLTYDYPKDVQERKARAGKDEVGQKQRWFALRFLGAATDIDLAAEAKPEFDEWRWTTLAEVPGLVIPWKRPVYEAVAKAFAPYAIPG